MKIHVYHHFPTTSDPPPPWVAALKQEIMNMSGQIQAGIDALRVQVERIDTVEDSILLLVTGLSEQLRAALEAAQNAGATPAQLAELETLRSTLETQATSLEAAVVSNTPAAPVP